MFFIFERKSVEKKDLVNISQTMVIRAQDDNQTEHDTIKKPRHEIRVGIFVTSLHDLDFKKRKYSMTAWVWGTYNPKDLPDDYSFSNHIEIVNAREWNLSSIEHFIINNPDGSQRSMAKFRATFNQNWDIRYFPFDKQTLKVVIESVELDSSRVKFVPDFKNSLISDDFDLSGWRISPIQLAEQDYEYPTTFGDPRGVKGVYPRVILDIPIKREGWRILFTSFLGFFASYIIVSMLIAFDDKLFSNRIGLIMSALFATVGNKYTVDSIFPPQANFTFSDLIQVATFTIIAIGLLNIIAIIKLIKLGKDKLAHKLDYSVSMVIIPTYPIIILMGLYFALVA
ncbi:MAG: hypothetical protein VSS75_019775 [Candidatus Parabeggiatoa sp.]|nr:hypothetical protein [Candidatus Parabeggiatoa sp.]